MKTSIIKLDKYFDIKDKNGGLKKGMLNLKDYIEENVDKLTLYIYKDFSPTTDKYHIKKIIIPCIENISFQTEIIKKNIELKPENNCYKLENFEFLFFSFKQEENLKFIENLIESFLENINYVEKLEINNLTNSELNLDLSQHKINIKNLELTNLNNVKINFANRNIEKIIFNKVKKPSFKGLSRINKFLFKYIEVSKTNEKNYKYIFENIKIENLEISNSNLNTNLVFKNLKYLDISDSKIKNLKLIDYMGNFCSITGVELKNLEIEQYKNKKTNFLIDKLFMSGNFSMSEIKSLHIENSYIKKSFSINKSEEIKIYNMLAENIKINNVNKIFYEEDFENFDKYNINNDILKNINLIIENSEYTDFMFYLESNINRYIKLKKVNKLDIVFLAKFEKIEDNSNILNFENLIKVYKNFKNITGKTNELTVKEYNLPINTYENKENSKKIKEFFNIIQNSKNNKNLEFEILNYFFQNIKDRKWLENNLKSFKNYKRIANKISGKILCI